VFDDLIAMSATGRPLVGPSTSIRPEHSLVRRGAGQPADGSWEPSRRALRRPPRPACPRSHPVASPQHGRRMCRSSGLRGGPPARSTGSWYGAIGGGGRPCPLHPRLLPALFATLYSSPPMSAPAEFSGRALPASRTSPTTRRTFLPFGRTYATRPRSSR
jgi:hypothetical protein